MTPPADRPLSQTSTSATDEGWRVARSRLVDVMEVHGKDQPFDGVANQVGRGRFDSSMICWHSPGIDILVWFLGQPIQNRAALRPGRVVLTAPLTAERTAYHNGRAWGVGELLEFQVGQENHESLPRGVYLDVQIDVHLADARGWSLGGESVRVLPDRVLSALRSAVARQPAGRRTATSNSPDGEKLPRLVTRVLDSGRLGAARWPIPTTHSHEVVRTALELIESSIEEHHLSVSTVASSVGVSKSTLHDAFQREVGTSPYDYFLVSRLNRLRRSLLTDSVRHGSIRRAAIELGFDHLGRMGQQYRRLFGETPRETVSGARPT